jgi:tetratricopeptide (TPR) repeat protein
MKEEYENSRIDYSAELSAKSATISQLQKTITNLENEISKLNGKTGSYGNGGSIDVDNESYEKFFEAWEEYRNLKEKEYTDDELVTLAYKLWKIKDGDITQGYASDMLKTMRDEVYPVAAKKVYSRAKDLFEREMYEEAITWLSAASDMDKDNENPIYYIGRSYQALEKYQEALEYFRKTLEVAPNTTLKELVEERIEACEKELP